MKKLFKKAIAILLTLSLSISALGTLASCGKSGGSLKFESMTIDTSAIQTSFAIGEETVDFSGVKATIKYNDSSKNVEVGISNLEIVLPEGKTYENLTAFSGNYDIVVKYLDPLFNNATRTASFKIYVESGKEAAMGLSFTLPQAYSQYQQYVNSANDSGVDDNFFSDGVDKAYYAGSQNDFVFKPNLMVRKGSANTLLSEFVADIDMSVLVEDQYEELTEVRLNEDVSTYSLGTTTFVTVNKYTQSYSFNDSANGQSFKITVTPSEDYYGPLNALTIDVKVIDAYNVYNEYDLAAFDNSVEAHAKDANLSMDHISEDSVVGTWEGQKKQGVGLAENGIVLHRSLTLTQEHIPSSFYWNYKDVHGQDAFIYPSTNTSINQRRSYFLYDCTSVFIRYIATGDTFNFYGNFFQIDVSQFPVIASNNVDNDPARAYEDDFSNSQLFDIQTVQYDTTKANATINFQNINFKGNAPISGDVDIVGGDPVNAGGLILVRSIREDNTYDDMDSFLDMNVTNVISTDFFIAYKPEMGTLLDLDKVKVRDSNYNAIFAISTSVINITNSYLQRAGGPLMMLSYRYDDDADASIRFKEQIPEVYASNSVLESYVDGSEIWFQATKSGEYLENMKAMDGLFNYWTGNSMMSSDEANNRDGKLNMVCVNMTSGSDVNELLTKLDTQGYFKYDYAEDKSVVMNRKLSTAFGAFAVNDYGYATYFAGATVVGIYADDTMDGDVPATPLRYVIQSDTTQAFSAYSNYSVSSVYDPADAGLASIANSRFTTLLLGGFGIVIELFPLA